MSGIVPVVLAGRLFIIPAAYEPILGRVCTYTHKGMEPTGRGRTQMTFERRQLYALDGDDMIIPRGLMFACEQRLKESNLRFEVVEDACPFRREALEPDFDVLGTTEWRYRQFDAFCLPALHDCSQIEAVTAFGKSFIVRKIAKAYKHANILVVVPGIGLSYDMWYKLGEEIGHGKVGSFGGDKPKGLKRVTVTTPQSMHKVPPDWPDIILYDEVHTAAADTASEALMNFNKAVMLGFSGTTYGRSDNAEKRIEAIFGPIRIKVPYKEAVAHGMITPVKLVMRRIRQGVPAKKYILFGVMGVVTRFWSKST